MPTSILFVALTFLIAVPAVGGEERNRSPASVFSSPDLNSPVDSFRARDLRQSRDQMPFGLISPTNRKSSLSGERFGILDSTSGSATPAWKRKGYSTTYHWLP